jgi:hypothetical protein
MASVGPQYEFYSAGAVGNATDVAALGSGSFVVGYGYGGAAYAKVGIVSGDAISFGPEKYLGAAGTTYIRAVKLDPTHVAFVWDDEGVAIRIVAGIVSGTDITLGSVDSISGSYSFMDAAATDSTHFVLAYRDGTSAGKAYVVHVSGTTVSKGGVVTFFGSNFIDACVAAVSSTKVVVGYLEVSGWTGKAKVGTVAGVDITFGSEATFESSAMPGYPVMADGLGDGSRMVIAYACSSPSGVRAVVGTVSGTTVSFGTTVLLATMSAATYLDVSALSSTRIMVAYLDAYNADPALRQARAKEGTVSGTDITFGPASDPFGPPNIGAADFLGTSALSSTAMVVSYKDGSDAGHGTANVVTHSTAWATEPSDSVALADDAAVAYSHAVAVASDPAGVPMSASPNDEDGSGNGTTPFSRRYADGAGITITAPAKSGSRVFLEWRDGGGNTLSSSRALVATVNGVKAYTAHYEFAGDSADDYLVASP